MKINSLGIAFRTAVEIQLMGNTVSKAKQDFTEEGSESTKTVHL